MTQVQKRFAQSKIDFLNTKADRYILSLYYRLKREYVSGKHVETPHKKDAAALLVELGYRYLRSHKFNIAEAESAIK